MATPKYVPRRECRKQALPKAPTTTRFAQQVQQELSSKAEERLKRAQDRAKTFKVNERGHNDALLDGVVRAINFQTGELTVEFDPITSPCVIPKVVGKKARVPKGETVRISSLLFHHANELALLDKASVPVFVEPRKTRRDL